jgi:phosphate transport system ATP-binding protein
MREQAEPGVKVFPMSEDAPMLASEAVGPAQQEASGRYSSTRTPASVALEAAGRALAPPERAGEPAVTLDNVKVTFGEHVAVRNVTLALPARQVTALVGPSGCGKTTVLRAINRLHDHTGGRVEGTIRLGDVDVYAPDTDPELVRARIGMVFQRPNPFPTMSILDNVTSGLRFNGIRNRALLREAAESALRHAALWDIVKDRLHQTALRLSGGQQQRLCIARALAIEPDVMLMDEPCSALDPVATEKIENLITNLAREVTIVLVTHNMFQAARVSDNAAVFLLDEDRVGELVEVGPTVEIFDSPRDERTKQYVTGHVG